MENTKKLDSLDNLDENTKKLDKIEDIDENNNEKTTTPVEKKKPSKKKKIIISTVIGLIILLIVIVTLILILKPNKTEEKTTSKNSFINTINKSLEDGSLKKEVKKALKENNINQEKVSMISLDIDSDKNQELIAYVEDDNSNYLLDFEVDDEVTYEESYKLDSKESIGYIYSISNEKAYWYTKDNDKYSVISDTTKIVSKEEFENNYYEITSKYDGEGILEGCINYYLDNELDLEDLEDNTITNKGLLKDNDLTLKEIKEKATKYIEDKKQKEEEEKIKKEQEEKEKQAQLEKERKEKEQASNGLKVGSYTFKFGTYNIEYPDGSQGGTLTINPDYTCTHLGAKCTYRVDENINVAQDPSYPAHAAGIILSDGTKYIASINAGEFTDLAGMESIKYAG